MRAGDANHRLGVSAIFHSKRLNNDEPRSASSRLLITAQEGGIRRFCRAFGRAL